MSIVDLISLDKDMRMPDSITDGRITFPHCDPRVLHAPGECKYCDMHPEWQSVRKGWGINYTGHKDPALLPCPAEMYRDLETIDRWPGNRATKD